MPLQLFTSREAKTTHRRYLNFGDGTQDVTATENCKQPRLRSNHQLPEVKTGSPEAEQPRSAHVTDQELPRARMAEAALPGPSSVLSSPAVPLELHHDGKREEFCVTKKRNDGTDSIQDH